MRHFVRVMRALFLMAFLGLPKLESSTIIRSPTTSVCTDIGIAVEGGTVGVGNRGWDRCGRGRTASTAVPDGSRTPSQSPFVAPPTPPTPQFPTDLRVVDATPGSTHKVRTPFLGELLMRGGGGIVCPIVGDRGWGVWG